MKRNLNNVFEVEINFMGLRCIGKSIERFLRFSFEILDNTDDCLNSRLVDQTARPINEQADICGETQCQVEVSLRFAHFFVYLIFEGATLTGDEASIPFRVHPRLYALGGGALSFTLEVEVFGVVPAPNVGM